MPKGLYTNSEIIVSVIDDLNNALKLQSSGQHLQACVVFTGIAQRLANLRNTIDNDLKNRDETIDHLKDELRKRGVEVIESAPDDLTGEKHE